MRVYLVSWSHLLVCFLSLYLSSHRLAWILSLERYYLAKPAIQFYVQYC